MAGIEALLALAFLRSLEVPDLRANPAGGPLERSGVQLQQNHLEQPQVELAAFLLSLSLVLLSLSLQQTLRLPVPSPVILQMAHPAGSADSVLA